MAFYYQNLELAKKLYFKDPNHRKHNVLLIFNFVAFHAFCNRLTIANYFKVSNF